MGQTTRTPGHLPISPFQKLMIATALDPDTHPGYHEIHTVRWGFRVTPAASARTLRRAFDKLVARHDSLRLRFVNTGGDWRADILPEHPTGLIVEDLTALSKDMQDARISEVATTPKTALSDVLFDMHLFKCGRGGDVLVTRAQHAITDGFGMAVLIEELLKLVLNMPLTQPAMTHEEFVAHQSRLTEQGRAETEAFWRARLLPPPDDLRIGSLAKGLPTPSSKEAGPSAVLDPILDEAQSQRLLFLSKDTGVTVFSYLHAAFSEALCDLAGQDEVLINSILGRQDPAFMSFIGAEIQEVMLRVSRGPGSIEDSAQRVQNDMRASMDALPTDLFYTLDGDFSQQIKKVEAHCLRFFVHSFTPAGRLANSPFSKLFSNAMGGRISIGFVGLERIDWPYSTGFAEIYLSVVPSGPAPNAAMFSHAAAFDLEDLHDIADRMIARLGL